MNKTVTLGTKSATGTNEHKSEVALVLGGGGARGFAHLGIVKVLQHADLTPDLIVGTSMGAVIGAAAAGKVNIDDLIKILERLDINQILQISRESRRELEKIIGKTLAQGIGVNRWTASESGRTPVKLARFFTFLKLLTKDSWVKDLPIDYAAIATDLVTGKEITINEGKVYRAAAASSAIPGFIPPVKWKNHLLVDGGVVDPVPILPAVQFGAKSVLAVDIGTNLSSKPKNNPLDTFNRTNKIRKEELLKTKNSIATEKLEGRLEVLKPKVGTLNWLDFNKVKEASTLGKECIEKHLDAVRKLFRPIGDT